MLSPTMTVVILAVLWAIVVIPMVLRRNDERRHERSVDGFGQAMRALGRRARIRTAAAPIDDAHGEVFVAHTVTESAASRAAASPARRPVPAVQEALMYPVDRAEMSQARAQMMARRRRSLSILIGGTALFLLLALAMGGTLLWMVGLAFTAGLAGYVYFLRTQALHDRDRRASRQERASTRRGPGYNATSDMGHFEEFPESVVRIDDDDLDLHNLDTIDLTGLYVAAEDEHEVAAERRAS